MAYSGLESIYQNEGPATGATVRGFREGMSNVADLQTMMTNQQAYEQAQQLNPIKVAQQQEELARIRNENAYAEGVLGSKISAANQENLAKVSKSQVEKLDSLGRMAAQIGTLLGNTPEGLPRQQRALGWMQENSINPNSKIGQYILTNPPEKLIEVSQKLSQLTSSYQQALMQKEMALEQERMKQRGATEREEKAIAAGKYKKSASLSWSQKFETLDANKQLMTLAGALQSGKSPITGEDMDEDEKAYFTTRYQQAKAIVDATNAARAQAVNQGIVPTINPQGGVELTSRTPIPSAGVPIPGIQPSQPARGTRENPIKLD